MSDIKEIKKQKMNTKELRIGNLVERITHDNQHVNFEKVEKLEGAIYGELPSSHCVPIKLNSDWLIKLGAKPTTPISKTFWISISNLKAEIHFEIHGNEIVSTIKSQFSDLILDPIKYVHQLQNLYYVLAGGELIIKF